VFEGVGLYPLACWDCDSQPSRSNGFMSLVTIGCCQVEVSAAGRSLVQRSSMECCVSNSDRES